jgi:hypothetical protein
MPYLQRTGRRIPSRDQRQDMRVPLRLEISWAAICSGRAAITSDLSVSGCYIESLVAVDVGDMILFNIKLPTGRSMQLLGEVLYQQIPIGFGIRFVRVTDLQRKALAMLVDYASQAQSAISRPRLVASAKAS